jgi:PTH1 family peptidyl-tRNA hydrolase
MNLSGISVKAASAYHSISPGGIIAVHDELELPLGYLSLKFGGGLGGHNGLRSMKENLGTPEFWRLRIGIGRPPGRDPGEGGPPVKGIHEGGDGRIAQWVLSNFHHSELECLEAVLEEGASLLVRALQEEPETLLPEWKKKQVG